MSKPTMQRLKWGWRVVGGLIAIFTAPSAIKELPASWKWWHHSFLGAVSDYAVLVVFILVMVSLVVSLAWPGIKKFVGSRHGRDQVPTPGATSEHGDMGDGVRVEAREAEQWGGRTDFVQHILVTNNGPAAKFEANIVSDIAGLDKTYGRANPIVWEHPHAGEKRLGRGKEGFLRLLACERGEDGKLEVWFFAVPEYRHQGQKGGYLPTQRYAVAADELMFEVCVTNIDKDVSYARSARMTFATDGKPTLELSDHTELSGNEETKIDRSPETAFRFLVRERQAAGEKDRRDEGLAPSSGIKDADVVKGVRKIIADGLELRSWLSVPSLKTSQVICIQNSLGWADNARAAYYKAGCPASVAILTDAKQEKLLNNGEYLRLVNEHLKMLNSLLGEQPSIPTADEVLKLANGTLALLQKRESEIASLSSPAFAGQRAMGMLGARPSEAHTCNLWTAQYGADVVKVLEALKTAGYSDLELNRIHAGPASHSDLRQIAARLGAISDRLPK